MNGTPPGLPQSKISGLATSSLVLGILAIVLCFIGPLLAIPAVICGHLGLSRVKQSGGLLGGKELAIGGLVTGNLSFAMIPIVGLLAAIAIPNFVKAREESQQIRASTKCGKLNRRFNNGLSTTTKRKLMPLTRLPLAHISNPGFLSVRLADIIRSARQ